MKIFDKRAALKQAETIDWEARQWGSQENVVAKRNRTWARILWYGMLELYDPNGKKLCHNYHHHHNIQSVPGINASTQGWNDVSPTIYIIYVKTGLKIQT